MKLLKIEDIVFRPTHRTINGKTCPWVLLGKRKKVVLCANTKEELIQKIYNKNNGRRPDGKSRNSRQTTD
jgi:hypothetical protein